MKKLLIALTAGLLAVTAAKAADNINDVALNWFNHRQFYLKNVELIGLPEVNQKTVNSSDYLVFTKGVIPENVPLIPVKFVYKGENSYGGIDKYTEIIFFFQDAFDGWHYWFPPRELGLTTTETIKKADTAGVPNYLNQNNFKSSVPGDRNVTKEPTGGGGVPSGAPARMPQPTPQPTAEPQGTPLSDAEALARFNALQDRNGRPHAKAVHYDSKTDSYDWIGPTKGRKMSEPRDQFESETASSRR
jgi:hypothetical protein